MRKNCMTCKTTVTEILKLPRFTWQMICVHWGQYRTTCVPWKVSWHLHFHSLRGCYNSPGCLSGHGTDGTPGTVCCPLFTLHCRIVANCICRVFAQPGSPRHSVTRLQPLMDWALHYKLSSELQVLPFQQKHRAVAVLCIAMRLAGSAGCVPDERAGWRELRRDRWQGGTQSPLPAWPHGHHGHTLHTSTLGHNRPAHCAQWPHMAIMAIYFTHFSSVHENPVKVILSEEPPWRRIQGPLQWCLLSSAARAVRKCII